MTNPTQIAEKIRPNSTRNPESVKIYLDCEFNGFAGKLISMALVAEDGREFYEVLPCDNPVPWVAEHVMPILGKPAVANMAMFHNRLRIFLAQFDSIRVIADWPEDIVHFCQSLITTPGWRLDTPPFTMEIIKIEAESSSPHNALADARSLRDADMSKKFVQQPEAVASFLDQIAAFETERQTVTKAAIPALERLAIVAGRDTGQSETVRLFLLGLYNGYAFPFNLVALRGLDKSLFEDCMSVLTLDARVTKQEIHLYFYNGGELFERWARMSGGEQ